MGCYYGCNDLQRYLYLLMATNKYINLKKALNAYGKYVVQQSRSNLTKLKKGDGPLYNSISYELDSEKGIFLLEFLMEDYGEFQDKGVRGAGGTRKTTSQFNRKNNKGKIWKQKGGKSPYSFKEGRKPSVTPWSALAFQLSGLLRSMLPACRYAPRKWVISPSRPSSTICFARSVAGRNR